MHIYRDRDLKVTSPIIADSLTITMILKQSQRVSNKEKTLCPYYGIVHWYFLEGEKAIMTWMANMLHVLSDLS